MLFIIGVVHAYAKNPPKKQASAPIKNFLIDPSKPYVYLKVDHIGPRTADDEHEPATGIYLRLINNCRVPITVDTFGAPAGAVDYESGVEDRVVLNPTRFGFQIFSVLEGTTPILLETPDEILSLEMRKAKEKLRIEEHDKEQEKISKEKAQKEAEAKELAERPTGYYSDVKSLATIPPGMAVYFSLPINHVNKRWHFEIPFNFDLRVRGPIHEPYSYVAFYWDDLPESYRQLHQANANIQERSAPSGG